MSGTWGDIFYQTAAMFAAVIAALALVSIASEGKAMIPVFPFALAGLLWLIGWFAREVSESGYAATELGSARNEYRGVDKGQRWNSHKPPSVSGNH